MTHYTWVIETNKNDLVIFNDIDDAKMHIQEQCARAGYKVCSIEQCDSNEDFDIFAGTGPNRQKKVGRISREIIHYGQQTRKLEI